MIEHRRDCNGNRWVLRLDELSELPTVHPWKHEIDYGEIRLVAKIVDRRLGITGGDDVATGEFEVASEQVEVVFTVIDNENLDSLLKGGGHVARRLLLNRGVFPVARRSYREQNVTSTVPSR